MNTDFRSTVKPLSERRGTGKTPSDNLSHADAASQLNGAAGRASTRPAGSSLKYKACLAAILLAGSVLTASCDSGRDAGTLAGDHPGRSEVNARAQDDLMNRPLTDLKAALQVPFSGSASIEVGSPFVGLEFHHSSPLPMRVSFYYPVANSIDLSSDYWTRDQWKSMVMGLRIGDGDREWIGMEPYETVQTPYEVTFSKADDRKSVTISYRFSKDSPAYVVQYEITNLDTVAREFELYTDLQASLKTSHTYSIKDKARGEYRDEGAAMYLQFDDPETQHVQLFSANAGLMPVARSTASTLDSLPVPPRWHTGIAVRGEDIDLGLDLVLDLDFDLDLDLNRDQATGKNPNGQPMEVKDPYTPAFRNLYRQTLAPGETMTVVQITGSAAQGEAPELVERLLTTHRQETDAYEDHILRQIREKPFVTGDPMLDKSVLWSHGILGANMHYIDGSIQPMPCPAQYNFYFTHDVLLSNLGAVNFDLPRVRKDLAYIISHADSNHVIPHAYYWKDLGYAKEMAPPDNWNHFWFVITAASYLRHSGDEAFLKQMYPYIAKSVADFQIHKKDDIIYSYRPDWWDIAWNFGPRAYTTILATKALRDFVFISSVLGENGEHLAEWEAGADRMQAALNKKLWSDEQEYLINYFEDGSLDAHYYIGSLLGNHYDMLDADRKEKLAATAGEMIVDPKIGVYTVYPMDFHMLTDYLKLVEGEVGEPFYYINGGIWPHGNAWYALALMETGNNDAALTFIRDVMTLDGIINSPNGQPAMYEYRVSKKDDPSVYGKIDKPQFTWAAAWHMYSLYNLYGVKENEWNIAVNPWLPENQAEARFVLSSGGRNMMVHVQAGSGPDDRVSNIRLNGERAYSTVLPYGVDAGSGTGSPGGATFGSGTELGTGSIEITLGQLTSPLLTGLSARLQQAGYDEAKSEIKVDVAGFPGHRVEAHFESPYPADHVLVNGERTDEWTTDKEGDVYRIRVKFVQEGAEDAITVVFTPEP